MKKIALRIPPRNPQDNVTWEREDGALFVSMHGVWMRMTLDKGPKDVSVKSS